MNLSMITPVVKRLILLNLLVFLFTDFIDRSGNLKSTLALYYFESDYFQPFQLISHMFTHGNMMHIFFNMFALFMFGTHLERVWGPKRFLIFYLITGFGAVILHQFVDYIQFQNAYAQLPNDITNMSKLKGWEYVFGNYDKQVSSTVLESAKLIKEILYTPVVGASGAVFGIMAGFAMLFPNTELMLIFFPMPIKAKYFVPIYAGLELFLGLSRVSGDNIAHFAHLGGALFGFILVMIWRKDRSRFY